MNRLRQTLLLLPRGPAWLYLFAKRGYGLPLHSHGPDLVHTIACTGGSLRVTINGKFGREVRTLRAGEELADYELQAPHEIAALEDCSSALNIYLSRDARSLYQTTLAQERDLSPDVGALTFPVTE